MNSIARWSAAAVALSLLASGCGNGTGEDEARVAYVRVVHAIPDLATVALRINGETVLPAISYGAPSAYATVNAGSRSLSIYPAGSSVDPAMLDTTISFKADSFYTVFLGGRYDSAQVVGVVASNYGGPVDSTVAELRLLNLSHSTPVVDVYATVSVGGVANTFPMMLNLGFAANDEYDGFEAGKTFHLHYRTPGVLDTLLDTTFDTEGLINYSAVLADSPVGGLQWILVEDNP